MKIEPSDALCSQISNLEFMNALARGRECAPPAKGEAFEVKVKVAL